MNPFITQKERLVWIGTVYSRTDEQIAASLGISHRTVESRRHTLRRKLGVQSFDFAALVRLAASPKFFQP